MITGTTSINLWLGVCSFFGRPRSMPDDVVARIVRERTEGKTAYAIARNLNQDAVPTAQGARAWSKATVRALLMREGVH